MASIRALSRNFPYLRQQFSALLGNTSPSVKFICIVVLLGYFLSYSDEAVKVLSVTPGYVLPPSFWVWTAFTFCFLELHFWEVLVDIITVGLCGKLIEPLWGQMEMMTFFAVTNVGVAIITSFFYLFLYMCTSNVDLLFFVHIHGLAGYVAAVSVAVKQIMPEQVLIHTPLGKISNTNIPISVLLLSLILKGIGLLEGTHPAMFCSGLIISWVYLRFFQRHSNGSRGDTAESFMFTSFFPNVMQPPIAIVGNSVYEILVKLGLCQKSSIKGLSLPSSGINISLPGVDPHDMERRRQIALKALSERLSKSSDINRQHILPAAPLQQIDRTNISHMSRYHNTDLPQSIELTIDEPSQQNKSLQNTQQSSSVHDVADSVFVDQQSSHVSISLEQRNSLL